MHLFRCMSILHLQEHRVAEYILNEPNVKHGLNQVMIPMGGDFQYIEGEANYETMDKMLNFFNSKMEKYNFHFFYSTPYCYLRELKRWQKDWSVKKGDFMPYISGNRHLIGHK